MNADECLAKSLLKRDRPDSKKALESVKTAEHKLSIAEKELEAKIFENAVTTAYTAMFHAARALLYRDGFKERSHYALCVYVSEKYEDRLEKRFLHSLESLRQEHHHLTYGIGKRAEVSAKEAEKALQVAREFTKAIKRIL